MLNRISNPELVIGLVAPVGTDLRRIKRCLQSEFEGTGYQYSSIKVTDVFPILHRAINSNLPLLSRPYLDRVRTHISFGNAIRELFERDEILAASAIFEIARKRRAAFVRLSAEESENYQKRVYVIDQLKRPEEITLLRNVYGPQFFQLSVYARRETRTHYISNRISSDLTNKHGHTPEALALDLIHQDENEGSEKHGQRVAKTFHGADFIISTESVKDTVDSQIHRFLELLFGSNSISPTRDEYGLHAAKVAALRTLDLSRQVGAAIFTANGEVLAMGSNEVPKGGGGTYWSDGSGLDAREYTLDGDTNEEHKSTSARELFNLALEYFKASGSYEEFTKTDSFQDSRVMATLEYGRIIHAEMSALMDASRRGVAVKDGILFTTTFPCHLCAKHIVAAGISRVVYLEPYPKSLVSLHADSISVDGGDRGRYSNYPSVKFEHFYGVTPRRYRELFERGKRKGREGAFQPYITDPPSPIVTVFRPAFARLEQDVIKSGLSKLQNLVARTTS